MLQLLSERPRTAGEIFQELTQEREPLPWLGDIMLPLHILDGKLDGLRTSQNPRQLGRASTDPVVVPTLDDGKCNLS